MRVPSIATIRRLAQRRPLVLLYHRVADLDQDSWRLAVRPADFEQHVRVLSRFFTIVPLASLVPEGDARPRGRGRIAITFDDGYLDNFEAAWPVLRRHGVPATFFIAGSTLESGREFWWDALERLFLTPGTLPARLTVESDGAVTHVEPGSGSYSDRDVQLHRNWTADRPAPTARHRAFLALWAQLRDMRAADRCRAIADLYAQARVDPAPRATHRPMTPDHVRRMSAAALVEIGAHTVSHGRLSAAPAEEQRQEVVSSKGMLEEMTGRRVTSFSYPFGAPGDYSSTTIAAVRDGGFHRACAAWAAPLEAGHDRFETPRCCVPPGGARTLMRHVVSWLAAGDAAPSR